MKESKFIGQNKSKWQEFEKDLRYKQNKATRLSQLFVQVTDDLSYARTFYKFRSVKVYLNGLAQKLFNDLYRNQSGSWSSFVRFWKMDLPMLIHDSRKEFRIAFIVFLLSFGIGILSSYYDKDFARLILGEDYVNMTIENIKKNDPMAVYKEGNSVMMFFGITINNLMVALATFVLGFLFSIGAVFRLVYNGIMVGAFQFFFIERGLFKESFLTIWQHGTLEISCIIIAGAAGITLGKGLLFPGTYSRTQSFKISAFRGLKIFIGITPIIILAAFIEGFFTRYTGLSDYVRIMVIVFSLAFILIYFVWYPWFLSKRHKTPEFKTDKVAYKVEMGFYFNRIMTADEIMGYSFRYIIRNKVWVLLMAFGLAFVHAITAVIGDSFRGFLGDDATIINIFQTDTLNLHFLCGLFTLTLVQLIFIKKISKLLGSERKDRFWQKLKLVFSVFLSSAFVLAIYYLNVYFAFILLVLVSPFVFLSVYQGYAEQRFIIPVLLKTIPLLKKSWGKLYWNSAKIFIFLAIFFLLTQTPLMSGYIQTLYMSFNFSPEAMHHVHIFIVTFSSMCLFAFFFIFQIVTSAFSYHSFLETNNAVSLKQRIEKFGERNIIFGFEKE